MNKLFFSFFIIIFTFILFFCFYFSTTNLYTKYSWPISNYTTISSNFGYRIHPITFKTSYHSGIDIPAPEGTSIKSICSGVVEFIGFNGAYGYSIIIKNNNFEILYGHVSPNFIISTRRYYFTRGNYWKCGSKIYYSYC